MFDSFAKSKNEILQFVHSFIGKFFFLFYKFWTSIFDSFFFLVLLLKCINFCCCPFKTWSTCPSSSASQVSDNSANILTIRTFDNFDLTRKNRENVMVLYCLVVDNFDLTRKNRDGNLHHLKIEKQWKILIFTLTMDHLRCSRHKIEVHL